MGEVIQFPAENSKLRQDNGGEILSEVNQKIESGEVNDEVVKVRITFWESIFLNVSPDIIVKLMEEKRATNNNGESLKKVA